MTDSNKIPVSVLAQNIKHYLKQGNSLEQIRGDALNQGIPAEDFDAAVVIAESGETISSTPLPDPVAEEVPTVEAEETEPREKKGLLLRLIILLMVILVAVGVILWLLKPDIPDEVVIDSDPAETAEIYENNNINTPEESEIAPELETINPVEEDTEEEKTENRPRRWRVE